MVLLFWCEYIARDVAYALTEEQLKLFCGGVIVRAKFAIHMLHDMFTKYSVSVVNYI